MRWLRYAVILIVLTPGCGVNVCAIGFGQCESMFGTPGTSTTTTSTSSGALAISGNSSVVLHATASYTATGGNGSYTFSVSPTTCGSFVGTTFTANAVGSCTILVTDTSSPQLSGTKTVTVTSF